MVNEAGSLGDDEKPGDAVVVVIVVIVLFPKRSMTAMATFLDQVSMQS